MVLLHFNIFLTIKYRSKIEKKKIKIWKIEYIYCSLYYFHCQVHVVKSEHEVFEQIALKFLPPCMSCHFKSFIGHAFS